MLIRSTSSAAASRQLAASSAFTRVRPDSKVMPTAFEHASALVLGDVLTGGTVEPGGDPNLAVVRGGEDDAVVTDRVSRDDSLQSRELMPVERR